MGIAVGIGLMDFPFDGARPFWRWVDVCEEGGLDSIWQTDRLGISQTDVGVHEHHGCTRWCNETCQIWHERTSTRVPGSARGRKRVCDDRHVERRAIVARFRVRLTTQP